MMKLTLSFLVVLVLSANVVAKARELPRLVPVFGRCIVTKQYVRDRDDHAAFLVLMNQLRQNEIAENELNKEQQRLMGRYNEMAEYSFRIGGNGCSWYCGGGPYKITASSELPDYKDKKYTAEMAHDLDPYTAWVVGTGGDGIGEYIEYYFKANTPPVTEVKILNGYIRSERLWKANSRVKSIRMHVNGSPYAILALQDTVAFQSFFLPDTLRSSDGDLVLRFEIQAVYPGDKYKDVALTEINFDGTGVHCLVGGTPVVMWDGTEKPIEKIVAGDSVLTYRASDGSVVPACVVRTDERQHHDLVRLVWGESGELRLTKDHPVYTTNKGWASLQPEVTSRYENMGATVRLACGDTLIVFDHGILTRQVLTACEDLDQCQKTYTIVELLGGDSFFANKALVGTEKNIK